jgi:membrane-associated phospholipid phosphatase
LGGLGGLGGAAATSPLASEALITTHNGIAGTWIAVPDTDVDANAQEKTDYLGRLASSVRTALFGFEIGSRLGFTFDTDVARVFHLQAGTGAAPAANYVPLMEMKRPTQKIFADQLTMVANYADLRSDRAAEIIAQLATPLEFLRAIAFVDPARTPYTVELLGMSQWMATYVEMRLKYALACKRPIEWSPQIQPMIWTPTHGSLPSGHATEAFCMAQVLWLLLRDVGTTPYSGVLWGEMMMRLAARIAINRTVAGVHFPVDSAAGAVLGLNLGQYLVDRCNHTCINGGWAFDGTRFHDDADSAANLDFNWRDYYDLNAADPGLKTGVATPWVSTVAAPTTITDAASEPLKWLWKKAKSEWTDIT